MTTELGRAGNPSSLHASGRRARQVLEEARESIASDLGAEPAEVIFTAGGTEADNIAVRGSWLARRTQAGGNRVVITATEHPAVRACADAMAAEGAEVSRIGVDGAGIVDQTVLAAALAEPAAIVSAHWVNNETGAIQPIAKITETVARTGPGRAWVHSDAVQAIGILDVSFAACGLDLMSVAAHKIGGPVGIGALLVRKQIAPQPIGHGGAQERDLRSGTVPVALAAGFAAALAASTAQRAAEFGRLVALRERVKAGIGSLAGVIINGGGSPAIMNLGFEGVRADDLLLLLDAAGIDASTGSACTAGVSQVSEVLLAMGRTPNQSSAAVRISFGSGTTVEDVDRFVEVLPEALTRARKAYG